MITCYNRNITIYEKYFYIIGDELLTDAFKLIRKDGLVEVNCSRVTETTKIDDAAIGGNASAEEAGEGAEDNSVTGFDVAIQNRLVEMPPFDKKGYMVITTLFSANLWAHFFSSCIVIHLTIIFKGKLIHK